MRLVDASRYFDDIPAYDGYDDSYLFDCQFSTFDDASADGTTSKRRTLSIAPDITIPTRRVLTLLGERWIVGDGNLDGIYGDSTRRSHSMKKGLHSGNILTAGEAVLGSAGTQAYCQAQYFKDQIDVRTEAEYSSFYNIFFSISEEVYHGSFIAIDGRFFLVRGTYRPLEGYLACQSDELDEDCRVTVSFNGERVYDPVTDTYTGSAPRNVFAIRVDFNQAYSFVQESAPDGKKGDDLFLFAKAEVAALSTKEVFTWSGKTYQIVAVSELDDAWVGHCRYA